MSARELLADLSDAGVSVTADGTRLVIRPASKLTDAMRAAVREAKADLLALLTPTDRPAPTARIYRLTRQQADDAHATEWSDETIAAFAARRDTLLRRGYRADDADDLAERLTLRDRQADDRRMCVECRELEPGGRCAAARRGALINTEPRFEPIQNVLMRCPAFRGSDPHHP